MLISNLNIDFSSTKPKAYFNNLAGLFCLISLINSILINIKRFNNSNIRLISNTSLASLVVIYIIKDLLLGVFTSEI